jgi:hypothetical protein
MVVISLFGLFFGGTKLFINPQQSLSGDNESCVNGDGVPKG